MHGALTFKTTSVEMEENDFQETQRRSNSANLLNFFSEVKKMLDT